MASTINKVRGSTFWVGLVAGFVSILLLTEYASGSEKPDIESRINIIEYTDSTFYEIRGLNFNRVFRDVKRYGPVLAGKRHLAMLKFSYSSTFSIADGNTLDERLRITSANITLRYMYVLPRWVDYDRVSPEMQAKWHRYIERVKMHETNHKEIYQAVFAGIESEIERFSSETSAGLGKKFNGLINKKMQLANRLNDDFHLHDKALNNLEYLLR